MKIAIIGTGNVGAALATNWSHAGHQIFLGVNDLNNFKGKHLLENKNTTAHSIDEAIKNSEVILIATPPTAIFSLENNLQNAATKVVIDATNNIGNKIEPYKTVYHFIEEKTSAQVVKCFNTTGFENMLNPVYNNQGIDMFMAGNSDIAKDIAVQLALDCGFDNCIDFGKSDKVELLEKFALSWINLAIMQGHGRNMAFKILRR